MARPELNLGPSTFAAKAVEVKLGQELTENESLAPLHVTCDKCKSNLASESALKLHKTMYHKYDKVTSSRDMIDVENGFLNKQCDQTTQLSVQ